MNTSDWSNVVAEPMKRVSFIMVEYFPNILGAIALIVAGWVVARILRTIVFRISTFGVEQLLSRPIVHTRIKQGTVMRSAPLIVSRIVFWTVLLFFVAAGIEALGLSVVSGIVSGIMTYLPKVLVATAIFFFGLLLGDLSREGMSRAAARAGVAFSEVLGRLVQISILALTIMIAVDQLGIASTVLMIVMSVALATTLGAGALAFALGARTTVSNIIAVHYISRSFSPGNTIRIGATEGCILEITQTSVILDTPDGKTIVPASRFSEEVSVILSKGV